MFLSEMAKIKLTDAPADKKLKIKEITAGGDIKRHLTIMGLHVNDILIKQTWAKWGPVLVQNLSNSESKVAIGRGLADKIIVEI